MTLRIGKRLLTGSTLAAALAVADFAHAEDTSEGTQTESHEQHPSGAGPATGLQTEEGEQTAEQPQQQDQQQQDQQPRKARAPGAEQNMQLQRHLAERGHYQGAIDGIVGPQTRAALRDFQEQEGLQATGTVNEETASALGMDWEQQPVSGTEAQAGAQGGEHVRLSELNPEQARELQQKLQELGFYRAEIDGRVGPATRGALQRYFNSQAQLAGRGMLSESAITGLGVDPDEAAPVRGEDPEREPHSPEADPQRAPETAPEPMPEP